MSGKSSWPRPEQLLTEKTFKTALEDTDNEFSPGWPCNPSDNNCNQQGHLKENLGIGGHSVIITNYASYTGKWAKLPENYSGQMESKWRTSK